MEKELTRVELQLMNILWDKKKAFVNDILEELPEPKPAYNTISTFMRILVNKGFVQYTAKGKSHEYHPSISREQYLDFFMNGIKDSFFSGSFHSMISFFAKKESMSQKEIDQLMQMLHENKQTP